MIPIIPLSDWMVVKLDPRPTPKAGSIILVEDTERVRTGTVLKIGPGRRTSLDAEIDRIPIQGVVPGDTVAFFRENFEHLNGKILAHTLEQYGDDLAMIRMSDILYVVEGRASL